jgi:hypothetical protein
MLRESPCGGCGSYDGHRPDCPGFAKRKRLRPANPDCRICAGFGSVRTIGNYCPEPCECRKEPEVKAPPRINALAVVPGNPHPGTVDMNELRSALRIVREGMRRTLEAITTIKLDPQGYPTLTEYDRITALLRHYGIKNARVNWNPATKTLELT